MLIFLLKISYFMLPAYFANMAPVICRNNFCFLNVPIDGGRDFQGKPLFGRTKTWRGMIVGTMTGVLIVFLQAWGFAQLAWLKEISLLDYSNYNFLFLGFLFGFGALFGDLTKSFFKRRIGKQSSEPWKVIDQLDFVAGALLFISFVHFPGWSAVSSILLLSFVLTVVVNQVSFWLGIRDVKW